MTEVDGRDVGHCLELLVDRFPELRTRLFGTDARLRDWIEVYVNQRSCHPEELARTVRDGDEIEIVEAIVGG
jgi:molybdopterin converting factor small subunit